MYLAAKRIQAGVAPDGMIPGMRLTCCMAFLLLAGIATAGESVPGAVRVQGRVVDESAMPITDANVSLQGTALTVDAAGGFAFELEAATAALLRIEEADGLLADLAIDQVVVGRHRTGA